VRKLAFVSAVGLFFGLIALAQQSPPKPASEMANLKYFAGNWSCSGDSPAGPFGPAHKTQSTLSLKLDLDGFWYDGMMTEMKTASNPHPVKGMLHLGYDAGEKRFVQVWIDNTGSRSVQMSPGWEGDSISFTGEQVIMGEKGTAKDTITKKGASQFTHKFELTMKGETHTIVDEICRKKM
jgi:Protein of unknown function (DUF1579)